MSLAKRVATGAGALLAIGGGVGAGAAALGVELPAWLVETWRVVVPVLSGMQ